MKTIGLLGGTAWVSTVEYYRVLNRKINERLGKKHSARLILNSLDYEQIKQYNFKNWEEIGKIIKAGLEELAACPVECLLICNNALHKAYDDMEEGLDLGKPVIHITDSLGEEAVSKGYKKLLLLGTKFTMVNGFYQKRLANFGLDVVIPNDEECTEIHRITQEELSKEIYTDHADALLHEMTEKYEADATVMGCTELPMIMKQDAYKVPLLNTVEIHCEKAVQFSLGES